VTSMWPVSRCARQIMRGAITVTRWSSSQAADCPAKPLHTALEMGAMLGEVPDLSVAQDDLQYPAIGLKGSAGCGTSFLNGKRRQLEVASLHPSTGH